MKTGCCPIGPRLSDTSRAIESRQPHLETSAAIPQPSAGPQDRGSHVASHAETAALCTLAGERRLLVSSEHRGRFRAKLRFLGLGMPA